jgi:hypothetical protein
MINQPQLLQIALDRKDVVYTPDHIARDMVDFFKPTGRILEPAAGEGAILKYLPGADWCEIEKGRDFYTCSEHYDWIVGNPPYSVFANWLRYSFERADNIVYLIPTNRSFISDQLIRDLRVWGGIRHIRSYAANNFPGWESKWPTSATYYQKGYRGPMEVSFYE